MKILYPRTMICVQACQHVPCILQSLLANGASVSASSLREVDCGNAHNASPRCTLATAVVCSHTRRLGSQKRRHVQTICGSTRSSKLVNTYGTSPSPSRHRKLIGNHSWRGEPKEKFGAKTCEVEKSLCWGCVQSALLAQKLRANVEVLDPQTDSLLVDEGASLLCIHNSINLRTTVKEIAQVKIAGYQPSCISTPKSTMQSIFWPVVCSWSMKARGSCPSSGVCGLLSWLLARSSGALALLLQHQLLHLK